MDYFTIWKERPFPCDKCNSLYTCVSKFKDNPVLDVDKNSEDSLTNVKIQMGKMGIGNSPMGCHKLRGHVCLDIAFQSIYDDDRLVNYVNFFKLKTENTVG